jgi:large subunit ribosomal protein L25
MKSFSIIGTKRAAQEKHEARNLRAEGKVPCVLYGGKEQIHFSTPAISLKGLVYTPEVHTVDLNIDGTNYKAIMKDIQFHAVSDKIQHIDFLELSESKKVTIDIPVKITGNASGVRAGGQLLTKLRKLKISALPKDLPDSVVIKIDDMEIGDTVRVKDIKIKGVDFLDTPNNIITAVKTTRLVVEEVKPETPAAGAAAVPGAAPAAGAAATPGAAPAAGAAAAATAKAPEKAKGKEDKKK